MTGQPAAWASVGPAKFWRNQRLVAGLKQSMQGKVGAEASESDAGRAWNLGR
jgi:hypothetical protein